MKGAGLQAGFGSSKGSINRPRRLTGQFHRTLEKRGRSGQTPTRLRADRRTLELPRDVLIRSHRRVCKVPCPAVGVDLPVGRLRQREMHGSALLQLPPNGRPPSDQRVTQRHLLVDR